MKFNKQEKRILSFLGTAFEAGDGRQRREFSVDTVGANGGYSKPQTAEAITVLVALELIEQPNDAGQSKVTEKGADVAEDPI